MFYLVMHFLLYSFQRIRLIFVKICVINIMYIIFFVFRYIDAELKVYFYGDGYRFIGNFNR